MVGVVHHTPADPSKQEWEMFSGNQVLKCGTGGQATSGTKPGSPNSFCHPT